MKFRLIAVIVLLVAAFVASSGCGDDESESARSILSETFADGHPIDSGDLDLSVRVTGKGAGLDQSPINLDVAGPFITTDKSELPKFALELGTVGSGDIKVGFVSTGKQGYVTVGEEAFVLDHKAYQQLRDSYAKTQRENREKQERSSGLAALGIDPSQWLGDDVTVSDGEVDGQPTTRVAGQLDVDALVDDASQLLAQAGSAAKSASGSVPTEIDAAAKEAIGRSVKTAEVSIDSGREDRTLRAIALRLVLAVAEQDRRALGGLESLDVDLKLAISDLNSVKSIPAPKNAKPIGDLQDALGALISSPQQPKSGPRSTTTTTTTPKTGAGGEQDRYAQCLRQAGDDVAKIQRCAALINR